MSQKISPYIEAKWGWDLGESGWNSGMDENLLKFSFLFDGNVDAIVDTLPSMVNGLSVFLESDNRFYFVVDSQWYSTPTPKWFIFRIKGSGETYQYDGSSIAKVSNNVETEEKLIEFEATLSALGTAAYADISEFATTAQLDIVSSQNNSYTDVLRADISGSGGAALVGYGSSTVQGMLDISIMSLPTVDIYGAIGDGVVDDTVAFADAISNGSFRLTPGKTYKITAPLHVIGRPGFYLRATGAKIQYDYEQAATSPQYQESLFYVDGAHGAVFEGGTLEYLGSFETGTDYSGMVSGIHVERSDHVRVKGVEAFGFNRAGVNIATRQDISDYCNYPSVEGCNLHHNRVAGVIFGNTESGSVRDNSLTFNGIVTSIGTGYGFTGWSAKRPRNTLVANNQASDNYRKGIDFHDGEHGTVTGNTCSRNRCYGIYVMDVRGAWVISGNLVSDMTWGNEFPIQAPYGIRVGQLVGEGTSGPRVSYTVTGNVITRMTKTAGDMFPFGEVMAGHAYGMLVFADNIIDVGTVSQLYNSSTGPSSGTGGNYYDVSITGNTMRAAACTLASAPPVYIRGVQNRKKIISNNTVEVVATAATAGVISWDTTTVPGNSLIAVGNDITAPESAWSAVYDPINVRRTTSERANTNMVNGAPWRDWTGFAFEGYSNTAPNTSFWSRGSRVWVTTAPAGGSVGFYCTAAGSPGTWKAFGTVSA